MNYYKTKIIISKLISNAESLRYGTASVTVKKHDGRVVQVTYSTQEHTREQNAAEKQEE